MSSRPGRGGGRSGGGSGGRGGHKGHKGFRGFKGGRTKVHFVSQQHDPQTSQASSSGLSNPGPGKFYHFTYLLFFSSNLNIIEPKKPKLGKEKVWDVSPYRNEEMETLRKLGVQIEYLILPTEMSGSANSISMTCCKVPYSRIVEWQV